MTVTVFRSAGVVTMDPAFPRAEAVAVRDGRILGVGTVESLTGAWGPHLVDDTFAEHVLLPGFVEAHSHVLEGAMWAFEYVGYFERRGPDGLVRPGCRSTADLLEQLRRLDAELNDPDEVLFVWGFDPIYLSGERLTARHLDTVSERRPIFVYHASGHLATVNTALMRLEGFADGIDHEGVPHVDGRPLGELREAALGLATQAFRGFMATLADPATIRRMGQAASGAGLTTVTELGSVNFRDPATVSKWIDTTAEPTFPVRVVALFNATNVPGDPGELADSVVALRGAATDRFRTGLVKMILDGSIQGYTARLNPPGYLGDRPNGIWLMAPERFAELLAAFNRAHIGVHVHCNGDEAVDLFLDSFEAAAADHWWPDHRHTVQHCQLTTAAQYRRMAAMGMSANIFSNHLWYWGDQHHDLTVGPDRAARMDACATADREGVRYSVHCDASVTPFGPLHTAWCAVNRLTPSGRVLGEHERISVERALRAVTIDAAHQLHLDHEIGSIEAGKQADFTALAEDPTTVNPMALRDIEVVGTVIGGHVISRR